MKKLSIALTLIVSVGLIAWGMYEILTPPVMAFGRIPRKPPIPYWGYGLVFAGVVTATFHRFISDCVMAFAGKLSHWLFVLVVIGVHGALELLRIPHQEEWFLAVLSGGITFTALRNQWQLWLYQLRQWFRRKNA